MTNENVVARTFCDIERAGALTGTDVANVADVSKATVSRWRSGQSTPKVEVQLVLSDLRYVIDKLSEFYEPDEIRLWLYARNDLLGGETAMGLIHARRTEQVLDAIDRISGLTYV